MSITLGGELLPERHHSLEWYTRVYTTPDYGITYLCHDRRATANMGRTNMGTTFSAINWSRLVTLQWSGLWDVISLHTQIGDNSRS